MHAADAGVVEELDGVFRVSAPDTTPPGTYKSTLEIQYSGDLNLKDNTYRLPVTIVVPAPVADETALTIYQDTVPEVAPGQRTVFNVRYTSPTRSRTAAGPWSSRPTRTSTPRPATPVR
ncbi:hypothetical protein ACWD4B_22370 [Streptomyces sp. NPDC002536]